MPGILLFIAGIAMAPGARGWVATLIATAVCASIFAFVLKLNYRAARKLQRMIDELRD
jgi:Flp pilus assembly protein TadB